MAASVDGTLTAEKLDGLITEAAHTQMVDTYLGELRQRSERMFVEQFHKALRNGACDELLGTLRPIWDEHAAAVAEARSLGLNAESSIEHILESAEPGLVKCWQQLPGHLAKLNQIAIVARQFGPRVGNFPMVREFTNAAETTSWKTRRYGAPPAIWKPTVPPSVGREPAARARCSTCS